MARKTAEREPLRLWAVVAGDEQLAVYPCEYTATKIASLGASYRVVEFIEVRQPPLRDTEWGEGQFDYVTLGPGVQASLRITRDGRVKLTIPGGELDVTDGSASLGSGLHEAGARAAQIRERIKDRARKRAEKTAKP